MSASVVFVGPGGAGPSGGLGSRHRCQAKSALDPRVECEGQALNHHADRGVGEMNGAKNFAVPFCQEHWETWCRLQADISSAKNAVNQASSSTKKNLLLCKELELRLLVGYNFFPKGAPVVEEAGHRSRVRVLLATASWDPRPERERRSVAQTEVAQEHVQLHLENYFAVLPVESVALDYDDTPAVPENHGPSGILVMNDLKKIMDNYTLARETVFVTDVFEYYSLFRFLTAEWVARLTDGGRLSNEEHAKQDAAMRRLTGRSKAGAHLANLRLSVKHSYRQAVHMRRVVRRMMRHFAERDSKMSELLSAVRSGNPEDMAKLLLRDEDESMMLKNSCMCLEASEVVQHADFLPGVLTQRLASHRARRRLNEDDVPGTVVARLTAANPKLMNDGNGSRDGRRALIHEALSPAACAVMGHPDLATMRNISLLIIEYERRWPPQINLMCVSAVAACVAVAAGIQQLDNLGVYAMAELVPGGKLYGFPLGRFLPVHPAAGPSALLGALPRMVSLLVHLRDRPAETIGGHLWVTAVAETIMQHGEAAGMLVRAVAFVFNLNAITFKDPALVDNQQLPLREVNLLEFMQAKAEHPETHLLQRALLAPRLKLDAAKAGMLTPAEVMARRYREWHGYEQLKAWLQDALLGNVRWQSELFRALDDHAPWSTQLMSNYCGGVVNFMLALIDVLPAEASELLPPTVPQQILVLADFSKTRGVSTARLAAAMRRLAV